MSEPWPLIVAILALLVLLALGIFVAVRVGRGRGRHATPKRPARSTFRQSGDEEVAPPKKRVAIIINPTKFDDVSSAKALVTRTVAGHDDWDEPLILETTAEDPGVGQTRAALAEGVDLVCAVGGDGTVRAVAHALTGTSTPMGLIPAGTGNLLGRNLGLPLGIIGGLDVALTGRNRHIDVGWVTLDPDREQSSTEELDPDHDGPTEPDVGADDEHGSAAAPNQHAFLVMAGVGLDASIMHGTTEEAKARIGWGAYVATGAKNLLGARFATRLRIDGGEPIAHTARTVVVGNCGRLQGGITLMPDAEVDDGVLDVVAITPKGIVGWAGVAIHVLAKRGQNHPKLDRYRCQSILVSLDEPQMVEVDGDVIGEAKRVRFEVRPKSLIVRTDPEAKPRSVTIPLD
ncbi:diacylglycerol kinase [Knoellia sinensis KCTC 19936]|uniref:Diacylglycerol kinase n=1 Tax=Knoellia sinensis KCTC 19936 TaxID=1385520 RepID=A0A0A0J6M2_9MICO|nr:diacylglycerol kinase family protein [Knoellia sinensis]KGN31717.1 diacylglycerol kinase [Knoellia sinensis KCTC 19936]